MSVPDELSQAAAEAIFEVLFTGEDASEVLAVAALQAAFAKLAGCEAVESAIAGGVLWREHDHKTRPCCVQAILTALAREFGW